jgi:hypothetical protein
MFAVCSVHSVYFCVVHHQSHVSDIRAVVSIPSAGYEKVGGVIWRYKFASGGIKSTSLVSDHRRELEGREGWKIGLSAQAPGVEADPTLQDICNVITTIESTISYEPCS